MSASVFPARAGMSRPLVLMRMVFTRVPRASGDEPALPGVPLFIRRCSPRERG